MSVYDLAISNFETAYGKKKRQELENHLILWSQNSKKGGSIFLSMKLERFLSASKMLEILIELDSYLSTGFMGNYNKLTEKYRDICRLHIREGDEVTVRH